MITPNFFHNAHTAGFILPNVTQDKTYFPNTQCLVLDGKKVSEYFVNQCLELFPQTNAVKPHLAAILVGENKASQVYVKNKLKLFAKANFKSTFLHFSNEEATNENITRCISELNNDTNIHGILLQLPLPKHLNSAAILKTIAFNKDVDGFSSQNIGLLALNDSAGTIACTPFGIMILLFAYGINPAGKHCVVVGRSAIVGKPTGLLFLNGNATVTFVHSHTKNINTYTCQADILIVAAGKKHLISKNDIKAGAIVIDVGIHKNEDGTLSGDVNPNVQTLASALTPVPGGVGPMTVASLLLNTVICSVLKNDK